MLSFARRPGPSKARRPAPSNALVESLESRRLLSGGNVTFTQTNLVSDGSIPAAHTDPNLVNAWGISEGPTSPFWVSDNAKGVATLYDSTGTPQSLVVSIPGGGGGSGAPTGQVFNGGVGFNITANGVTQPSIFMFVGEDGGISGWNPKVDLTHAVLAVDQSPQGSVFKGATLGNVGTNKYLFAADFHNAQVDVFDSTFTPVHWNGAFHDSRIPTGYAPFNIQNLDGKLFVTYAKQNAEAHDDVAGPGHGFVDEFDTSGHLLKRFEHVRTLNSPWGLAIAPANFGRLAGDLLVGQFGSGRIAAFDLNEGGFEGLLRGDDGRPIQIDGLWALTIGNDSKGGRSDTLYFTAGPNDESNGLFGSLTANVRKHDDLEDGDSN